MNIPIVTLDKIYIKPDNDNVSFIDCTRVNGTNDIISRMGISLDDQIEELSIKYRNKEIIIADDVVFSGTVLKTIINKLSLKCIKVVGIITSICSIDGYEYFNETLKYGVRTNYLMYDVIDQVCERDFYFGVAGSGIMVKTEDGYFKAPYFKPYGNPYERASIPVEYEDFISEGCLERSLYLWKNLNRNQLIKDLPERIIRTDENETIVKTLKKGMKRI